MPEHSARGLEACLELERDHCWSAGMELFDFVHEMTHANRSPQFLFLEPNASDPLNKEAAEDLRSNREGFKRNVRSSMSGGAVKNQSFDRVLKS